MKDTVYGDKKMNEYEMLMNKRYGVI
jgi:hypothetical protein